VGIGIPIPVLDEDIAARVSIRNEQIQTTVVDYASPGRESYGLVSYKHLMEGWIDIKGKRVKTAPLSSLKRASEIASELAQWIRNGKFQISEPVQLLTDNV